MDRRKYGSTTGNSNNVSGPKISGLPAPHNVVHPEVFLDHRSVLHYGEPANMAMCAYLYIFLNAARSEVIVALGTFRFLSCGRQQRRDRGRITRNFILN
jgi:hypothetical protein